jgi:hypothetical protein
MCYDYLYMANRTPEEIREAISKSLCAPIVEALNNEGITPSRLAKKLNQILDAKEPKDFAFQGVIKDHVEYENIDAQLRAVDLSAKLLDIYPSERLKIEGTLTNLSDDELDKRINTLIDERQNVKNGDVEKK